MIKRVAIRGFQSWLKAELDLEPLTVIVGESDMGKSALIRALESVVQNRAGTDFITHGEKLCEVQAEIDGHAVNWSKPANAYVLDADVFDKVGRGVPEQVSELFDLHEATLAGQFDRPYLLFEPGTRVSEVLGELTNIALLYEAVRIAKNDAADIAGMVKSQEQQLKTVQEQADEMREPVMQLGTVVVRLQGLQGEVDALSAVSEQVKDAALRKHLLELALEKMEPLARVGQIVTTVEKALPLVQARVEQAARIRYLFDVRAIVEAQISQGDAPVLPSAEMARYEALVSTREEIARLLKMRGDLKVGVEGAEHNVGQYGINLAAGQQELEELVGQLAVCPLSGGELFDVCKQRLEQA